MIQISDLRVLLTNTNNSDITKQLSGEFIPQTRKWEAGKKIDPKVIVFFSQWALRYNDTKTGGLSVFSDKVRKSLWALFVHNKTFSSKVFCILPKPPFSYSLPH